MVLKLYGIDRSPTFRAVLMTAKAIGVRLDTVKVDFGKGEQFKPEYLELNPLHTVPTLTDDDFVLPDSHAINRYLVDKYAKNDSLFPKDLKKRALVDRALHYDEGVVFPHLKAIGNYFRTYKKYPTHLVDNLVNTYESLEVFLKGKEWFAGEDLTIADFSGVTTTNTLSCYVKISEQDFPSVVKWIKKCEALPYYKECNQKGIEDTIIYIKSYKDKL